MHIHITIALYRSRPSASGVGGGVWFVPSPRAVRVWCPSGAHVWRGAVVDGGLSEFRLLKNLPQIRTRRFFLVHNPPQGHITIFHATSTAVERRSRVSVLAGAYWKSHGKSGTAWEGFRLNALIHSPSWAHTRKYTHGDIPQPPCARRPRLSQPTSHQRVTRTTNQPRRGATAVAAGPPDARHVRAAAVHTAATARRDRRRAPHLARSVAPQ